MKNKNNEKYSFGIDIGYFAVKVVIINDDNNVVFTKYQPHKGQIKKTLELILIEIDEKFKISEITHGAITGSLGKQISQRVLVKRINEVAAAIEGSVYLNPEAKSIIEIGAQSAKYYTGFNTEKENTLRISKSSLLKISSNSDCAAGTGSFLEEQASRLKIKIENYSHHAQKAKSVPRIAGRCSVFAKTDIIHHQQEGVSSEDILKGLAYAIVKNYKGAVIRRLPVEPPILFIGGVGNNQTIIDALRDVLDKNESELVVPKHFDKASAIGAALVAKKERLGLNFRKMFRSFLSIDEIESEEANNGETLLPLNSIPTEDVSKKHELVASSKDKFNKNFFLGIDIGSTSTNLVLIDKKAGIVSYKYMLTSGNPLKAVQDGLTEVHDEFKGKINISGIGITGSGRYLIGERIGADVIKDEITAQAKAAVTLDPEVDTVFEIGGQDSKYISINNGMVTDFQMNKVCAAGTGSFLEEQAQKFNIPINEFGKLAMKGEAPVLLGERCTVFIESSIASSLNRGKRPEDIVSGLCYSIANNYLHRVVGQKKIGNKIFLQGGIAFNQGVANALKILTRKEIKIPPFFSVTGAYGAAILASEEMKDRKSKFKGFGQLSYKHEFSKKQLEKTIISNTEKYNKKIEKLIFEDYDGTIDPRKKTIGIPRALFTFGMFPMFNAIFKNLGFNVLLSGWSNEDTIKRGQEYSLDETCFPIKLITGHVAELVNKRVNYIFFPDLYTIDHPGSQSRQNYGCAYMQLAFKIVSQAMELEKKGIILLAPTIAFNLGQEFMKNSFSSLGKQLGKSKMETDKALQKGVEAFKYFEEKVEQNVKSGTKKLDKDKITFVIISKTYGVSDPVLNMGIPAKLMDMGYQVVPFFDLPEGDVAIEHPNMFWPFGQHILEPAYLIRNHPNMYAVLLTHHGCGPDSVLIHFFKEIMGNKPFLNIEVDEHASKIGVSTKIEAFVNSIKHKERINAEELKNYGKRITYKTPKIKDSFNDLLLDTEVYIPNIYPYSDLFKESFVQKGIRAKVLPPTNANSINVGRKYTLTNEYFSLTSLLGDCFTKIENRNGNKKMAFLIPQTEGAEVEGQYNRLIRTKLDEENYSNINVLAPFLEDIIKMESVYSKWIFRCFIVGDLIKAAPSVERDKYLALVNTAIKEGNLDISILGAIAKEIYFDIKGTKYQKRILAIGEPMIIFNDFLNDFTFKSLEDQEHRIVYFSFAEALWIFWKDFVDQNKKHDSVKVRELLSAFKNEIKIISEILKEESPFTKNIEDLVKTANSTIGYYAGAFARYRQAKALNHPSNIDGIITANSTYENTGVSLNILYKGFVNGDDVPTLNLSFDGNTSENDKDKVESFIYYL